MKPIRKPRWQISENKATPESVFWNRRHLLAAGGGLLAAGSLAELAGRDDGTRAGGGGGDSAGRPGHRDDADARAEPEIR